MAMLGKAALAMWWNIAPGVRAEFEHWHSHEHFPERLAIPGFLRAARWADAQGGEGFFVCYELAEPATLASPAYLARLNAPTPWSTRLMPHHRDMVRTQCEVVASRGGAVGRHALTLRLSAQAGREVDLERMLVELCGDLPTRPGLTGAHLLRNRPPAIAPTTEQKIRGLADRGADQVFLVCGYDRDVLRALAADELCDARLQQAGAAPGTLRGLHELSLTMVPGDPA
jgi:hypothetical protein